jgi:mannosyl-3-phosphoglycerate synthase
MRVTKSTTTGHVGHLAIEKEIEVVELDAGEAATRLVYEGDTIGVPYSTLNYILSKMAIIVPCKGEPPETIRGVLKGIPRPCTIILVSNSLRTVAEDRYIKEVNMLHDFCRHGGRKAFAIHQKDPIAAAALHDSGMPELLGSDRTVRNGKGEGMILGLALIAALCRDIQYVGFVDADSKIPGSPHEYCRIYASGFAVSGDPSPSEDEHVMVRVHWSSKPKVRGGRIDFSVAEGRSSRVVNHWLNRFLELVWDGCPVSVTTANAGEHAMTMSLALKLRMAGGYAIEPFHYVDLLERQLRFIATPTTSPAASIADGDLTYSDSSSIMSSSSGSSRSSSLDGIPVRVMQIRSANPHIHSETEDDHITAMWGTGLSTIYHHLLMDASEDDDKMWELKTQMEEFVADNAGHDNLQAPRVYPPLEMLDMVLLAALLSQSESLEQIA